MRDAYFGSASDWSYEVEPDVPYTSEEVGGALYALDGQLAELSQLVARSVSSFAARRLTQRCAGLLHCSSLQGEQPKTSHDTEVDPPGRVTAEEVGLYVSHCAMKKVVLLYAFGKSGLLLRPRADPSEEIELFLDSGVTSWFWRTAQLGALAGVRDHPRWIPS
ncbi:unnamed protein product [Durusdinium trenchii]|uniref:Uncharacterized protein n=1 Tax=Durusdinium trenchii TaxID=1381693 RepID=A0ABP0LSV1_9DINO